MPYVEPPIDVIDPWVTREMLNLGFHWEDIKDTLSNEAYTHVMATYHTLETKKPKVQHHTRWVKPFHPPELQSRSLFPAQEAQPERSSFQQVGQQTMDHESGQKAHESASPSVILESSTTTSESTTEPRTTTLPPSPGPRTAAP